MPPPPDAPPPPPHEGASQLPYRVSLLLLVVALLGLVAVRLNTRRIDAARTPLHPDVVILHVAGLRADGVDLAALADEIGLDADRRVGFTNAFSPSNNGTRSALSVLAGTLWLDLDRAPGPDALPGRLRAGGWRSLLIDDEGDLADTVGAQFDVVARVGGAELSAEAIRGFWKKGGDAPRFVFLHVGTGDDPLHSDTTESYVLRDRYRLRLRALRQAARAAAEASFDPKNPRPQLLALVGASGLELGEHPRAPDLPYDSQLRVPFLLGVKDGSGLPAKEHAVLVQTSDLAPTLLDMLDLRGADERDGDGDVRTGVSLESYLHGWSPELPHEALYFTSARHAAVRTNDWKLIAPLGSPWLPQAEGAELYSLAEDPAEVHDLLAGHPMGPTAKRLFGTLGVRLNRVDVARAGRR